jgi:hypothetical protein
MIVPNYAFFIDQDNGRSLDDRRSILVAGHPIVRLKRRGPAKVPVIGEKYEEGGGGCAPPEGVK